MASLLNPYEHRAPIKAPAFQGDPKRMANSRYMNMLSDRYELRWVAGQRGKPNINADMASGTEATREPSDPDFEIQGTNVASSCSAHATGGGVTFTTAGASADQVILAPHLDTAQSGWAQTQWLPGKEVVWECDISTGSNITAATIWAGLKLTNTPTVATDDDQVFVKYVGGADGGAFVLYSSVGGTDATPVVSSVVVAVSTRYRIRIVINADRTASVFIRVGDAAPVALAPTAALTSAAVLIPYIGVQADAAAAKAITVRGEAIGRKV